MKNLTLFLLLVFGISLLFAQDSSLGLNQGDLFLGLSPCFGWTTSGSPDNDRRNNDLNIGLSFSADYFLSDQVSVGAGIGVRRERSSVRDGNFESFVTANEFLFEIVANYFWSKCLCAGQDEVNPRIRPFVGFNTHFGRGNIVNEGSSFESRERRGGLGASASAGVLINLSGNDYVSFQGKLLSVERTRFTDPDTGNNTRINDSFGTFFNKNLWSVNFIRKF